MEKLRNSLSSNFTSILLSFALAMAVWVSAVISNDPNVEQELPRGVAIEITNQPEDLILMNDVLNRLEMRLRAPESIWEILLNNTESVSAKVDLSGLSAGIYTLPVEYTINTKPVRVISMDPEEVEVILERRLDRTVEISEDILITTALGFHSVETSISDKSVLISGPQSLVNQVETVIASLEISDVRESIEYDIDLVAYDSDGEVISGLDMYPETVTFSETVEQTGGYRDVAVRVSLLGQPAPGYRLTTISVSPPTVTVFSSNPDLVADLPGFVETELLTITGALDDIEIQLSLDLPEGINVVGEQSVEVLIGVAAIESSKAVNVNLELIGASDEIVVEIFPSTVDVIISGPVTLLDNLEDEDVYFFVDVSGYEPGTYLLQPQVEFLSDHLQVDSISPETIQVVISLPTPTPTPTVSPTPDGTESGFDNPNVAAMEPTLTPSPSPSMTPTITPTMTPTLTPTQQQ